jgi:2-iminobutanoate/2-iminopropanoate deaminase
LRRSYALKTTRIIVTVVFSCLLLASAVGAQDAAKQQTKAEYFKTPRSMELPFSDAVRVGNILYLSGDIGLDYSTMKLVPGGIKAETKQAMENIKKTLEKYGSSIDNVFKCTVVMTDLSEWSSMNEVYATYFKKDRLPARTAIGANALALGAKVEIECFATIDK